jgi:hypothetical protein
VKNLCKTGSLKERNRCQYQLTLWALRPHKVCCDAPQRVEPVDDQGKRALGAIVIYNWIVARVELPCPRSRSSRL